MAVACGPRPGYHTTMRLKRRCLWFWLLLSACSTDFDLSGKDRCRTDEDCVAFVCVGATGDTLGVCARPEPLGPSSDASAGLPDAVADTERVDAAVDAAVDAGLNPPDATDVPDAVPAPDAPDDSDRPADVATDALPVEPDTVDAPCVPAAEACDDGLDNDCDGRVDREDEDCAPPLTGRYRSLRWERGPRIELADVTVDAAGARIIGRWVSDLDDPLGGRARPDDAWARASDDEVAFEASSGDRVRMSPALGEGVAVGFDGDALVTWWRDDGASADPSGSWLAWVVSPWNDALLPPSGLASLDWEEPAELAELNLLEAEGGRGEVVWPFAELRSALLGERRGAESLRPMAYRSEGSRLTVELLDEGAAGVERLFDGALAGESSIGFGVHRFVGDRCAQEVSPGVCRHDPVLMFLVRDEVPAEAAALAGDWRLVGVDADEDTFAPTHRAVDLDFTIRDGVVDGAGLAGEAGLFSASESYFGPTLRLALRGDGLPTEGVTLEGRLAGESLGLFWDQGPTPEARPLNGGVYLLVRRSPLAGAKMYR